MRLSRKAQESASTYWAIAPVRTGQTTFTRLSAVRTSLSARRRSFLFSGGEQKGHFMLYAFLVAAIVIFIAEQGDKTQILAFALATKYKA